MTKYYVSRQAYWGLEEDNTFMVEVAIGGQDLANPDMLTCRWPNLGEGKEFSDPVKAAEAAIEICNAWRKDGQANANVGYGCTGGSTFPFEPLSYDDIRERAQADYERLSKCALCGEILGKETFTHDLNWDGDLFCRESCAEKAYLDADYDPTNDMPTEEED